MLMVYLLGSIPWEIWLKRRVRSSNLVLWVLLLDFFSGFLAVLLAWLLFGFFVAHLAAILVILGQMFSCFCNFRERTAYAVAAGALLVLCPLLILIGFFLYLLSLLLTRYILLSSLLATIGVVILSFVLVSQLSVIILICVIGTFLAIRQQLNWKKRWRRRRIF